MLYYFAKVILYPILMLILRPRVSGRENFKFIKDKPAIVIMNHISNWDPVLLAIITPGRRVQYMAKHQLFKYKISAWLMKSLGAFSVNRKAADVGAIKVAMHVIQKGGRLGIFPEGTRGNGKDILPFHLGLSMIAMKTKATVLPVVVHGRYAFIRRAVVSVGKPIELSEFYDRKVNTELLEEVSAKLYWAVKDLKDNG